MGRVIAAYRAHEFHSRPLSQEAVAGWLGITQAQLSRIENGDPIQDLGKLVDWARLFGVPPDLLWFRLPGAGGFDEAPKDGPVSAVYDLAASAAGESVQFARTILDSGLTTDTVDQLRWEIERIAIDYVHLPLQVVFRDLIATRDGVFALLKQRHRPRDARELYLLAGAVCDILAQGSSNAGNPRAAQAQLRAAWACAEAGDHDSLRAWLHGTAAKFNEWSGHQEKAVELAIRGSRFDASRESRIRLAALEARAAARIGDPERVHTALDRLAQATNAPDRRDPVVEFGGLLSFPDVKQRYYLGSTYGLIGEHEAAERNAQQAIDTYVGGPASERSYGDEALARIDVVNAKVALGDLDGAEAALAPLIELPLSMRITQLDPALGRTTALLRRPELVTARKAHELRDLLGSYRGEIRGDQAAIA